MCRSRVEMVEIERVSRGDNSSIGTGAWYLRHAGMNQCRYRAVIGFLAPLPNPKPLLHQLGSAILLHPKKNCSSDRLLMKRVSQLVLLQRGIHASEDSTLAVRTSKEDSRSRRILLAW